MASSKIQKQAKKLVRGHLVGMILFHVLALGTLFLDFKLEYLGVGLICYVIRIIGVTAGYHRLYSHRSYTARPVFRLALAIFGTWSGQGSLRRWVIMHRFHHQNTETVHDPHSPVVAGFWYAHFGWLLDAKTYERALSEEYKVKLSKQENWVSDHFNSIFLVQIPVLFVLGHYCGTSGLAWLGWGFFLTVTLSLHATFMVNSICHMFGELHPKGRDESRNNWFVSIVMLGEGWHANHHFKPSFARHGYGKQLDVVYIFLKMCQKIGWVESLNEKDGVREDLKKILKTGAPTIKKRAQV